MENKMLYEEMVNKRLDAVKLSLELAYSIPLDTKVDQRIGSVVVTYKKIKRN